MTEVIRIPNGIITLATSEAVCHHCERKIPFDEIEDKFMRQEKHYIRLKCKCKRFVGITTTMKGDYVAFDLKKKY